MTTPNGTAPRALCRADADGRITFELPASVAGDPEVRVLLRGRPAKGEPEPEEHALPLEPAGDGRLRAVLEPKPVLTEGRWDVLLVRAPGAGPERLRSGPRDLRALLDGHSRAWPAPVAVRVPYATKDGHLALRTWLRPAHAETDRVDVGERTTRVTARLHGTEFTDDGVVRVRLRGSRDREVTVTPAVDADRRGFAFTVDHAELVGAETPDAPGYWDVYVLPEAGAAPVRAGRLLDDVADRKHSFVHPTARVGGATVRPYYTVDNDLSFDVGPAR
ncbi:transferase [Streptomyces sp. NPDC004376]